MTKIKEIKVLNVAQPNAHKIIFNGKNIENRGSGCNFKGTIAIYASKTISKDRFEDQESPEVSVEDCDFGCIIGFVDLVDCIVEKQVKPYQKKWFHGPYGYVLENPVFLKEPIPVAPPKGAVIWWPLKGKDLERFLDQVDISKIKPIVKITPSSGSFKPKTSARAKLKPSSALAAIVGNEQLSYKDAATAVIEYIDDNGLYDEETSTVRADEKLKIIFGKSKIKAEEFKQLILDNLE